jgi:regulator of nucleoside diphosphate kinase
VTDLNDTMFARPFVYATEGDLARLRSFARAAPLGGPGVDLLLEEIARMGIAGELAARGLVRLGSSVTYRDLKTRRERTVRVVSPAEADLEENRVSVLSPIGAALIGLSRGAIFRWSGPDGSARAIKVVELQAA